MSDVSDHERAMSEASDFSDEEEFDLSDAMPMLKLGAGKKALLQRAAAEAENDEDGDEEENEEDSDHDMSGDEAGAQDDDVEDDDEAEGKDGPINWNRRVKQRVLVCSSRGINHRQRHLLQDLVTLLPHSKKESKLDQKKNLGSLNEIAELTSCNKVIYLEARRGTDTYMWLSHAPNGPSIKFQVLNIHTMDELNMTGNHLKGSRPILSFDAAFDAAPHTRVIKELLTQTFNTPKGHRKSKPFFDHVMAFTWADNKVWVRNYQLTETAPAGTLFKPNTTTSDVSLTEVGPRFVLDPIKVFQGSFGGITLWESATYLTPAAVRRAERAEVQSKVAAKEGKKVDLLTKKKDLALPKDPLADVFA
ncbi:hypothetical protein AMAG_06367 [Allomyces macrogynus ATCC 38327]|uniref:Brix domain-containing protein n=1 Tax=Allomyces macrogynus (strain ATCC 38327) TaxID=578462 RepID=A0A0L0SGR8_ALLM3|nr:hypothetical protein AMAG_06367 [Allomyces macrogynus ATCC 38327]|eukprot:KNE61550.1 hypothetical protein AMAG_06367 [Allomyces macrogynus ATCC 38327]